GKMRRATGSADPADVRRHRVVEPGGGHELPPHEVHGLVGNRQLLAVRPDDPVDPEPEPRGDSLVTWPATVQDARPPFWSGSRMPRNVSTLSGASHRTRKTCR